MMKRIEYLIKHNQIVQRMYIVIMSLFFRLITLFLRTDERQIIFQSMIGKVYGDSPKLIYDAIRKNPGFKNYKFVWAFEDPSKFSVPDAKVVKLNSLSYFLEVIKSGIWVTNVDIERGLHFKPKNTVYVNTWHGVPLKVIGNRQLTRNDYNYFDVDFMCYSSAYDYKIFTEDLLVPPAVLHRCGNPRNDFLYHVDPSCAEEVRKEFNIPDGKKVILYAPTWRDSSDGGEHYKLEPPMNLKLWEEELKDEYILLIRMHHLTTELLGIEFNDFARDASSYGDVSRLLAATDILISDYSGIMLDYSILERPMVSFAYDYDSYSKKREFYEDLREMFGENFLGSEREVLDYIHNFEYEKEVEKSRRIKKKYMDTEGYATKACMDFIIRSIKSRRVQRKRR